MGNAANSSPLSLFQKVVEIGQWSRFSSNKCRLGIPFGKCFETSWDFEKKESSLQLPAAASE